MTQADGLILFQAANCNHQIPAKLYEYFRARRPILALTDTDGDTAQEIRDSGLGTITSIDSVFEIRIGLLRFLRLVRDDRWVPPKQEDLQRYSREWRTRQLSRIFDEVANEPRVFE